VGTQIDGGLYIGHFGGVLIGPIRMGSDCNVAQQVTIGRRADNATGVPIIGNRVWIGAGSIVFGGIRIGDGVSIGPLTVVARSLPAKVLVMGNPMRLLHKNYDNSTEIYGKVALQ
jgi:serine O-acetyltransferase